MNDQKGSVRIDLLAAKRDNGKYFAPAALPCDPTGSPASDRDEASRSTGRHLRLGQVLGLEVLEAIVGEGMSWRRGRCYFGRSRPAPLPFIRPCPT
eukprot:3060110-Rhodomonas_salina.1